MNPKKVKPILDTVKELEAEIEAGTAKGYDSAEEMLKDLNS